MKKILHRIFFNFDDGPDPFLPYLETWKKELPDFEIMLWDKTNLPLNLNAYTRKMAERKNHAFLSDFFRCWLLKKYGGMYLDADIEILDGNKFRAMYEEAQTATDYTLFIGIESTKTGGLTPHSMGIREGENHEILDFLMGLYENVFSGPMGYVIRTFPMPDLMSLYFMQAEDRDGYVLTKKGCFIDCNEAFITKGIKIYPQSWLSPVTQQAGDKIISAFDENTCMCHHFAATWKKNEAGVKTAQLFRETLFAREYKISDAIRPALEARYGKLPFKSSRPLWHFSAKEVQKLERVLNRIVPYGGFLYTKMRKIRKQKEN